MKKRLLPAALLFVLLLGPVFINTISYAGSGAGAIALTFNTSSRAEAMGGGNAAVIWGPSTCNWANPALLAYRTGVNYSKYDSKLAVGLGYDTYLHNEELIVGYRGVGLQLNHGPVNGLFLDMGAQTGVDENGNPIGLFRSYSKSKSYGMGVSLGLLLDNEKTGFSRYVDIAGGFVQKEYEATFGGLTSNTSGAFSARDVGYVVRVTPFDTSFDFLPEINRSFGVRIEATYAASVLNQTHEFIHFEESAQFDPLPKTYVTGQAVHAEMYLKDAFCDSEDQTLGLLDQIIDPLLSYTYSWQTNEPGYVWTDVSGRSYHIYQHDKSGQYDENFRGWELGILNCIYIRRGHTEILHGDIDADTEGHGFHLNLSKYGGIGYDYAKVPQASGFPTVERETYIVWVNALEFIDLPF